MKKLDKKGLLNYLMALRMENILMNFMENELMIFIIANDSPLMGEILGQVDMILKEYKCIF